MSTGPPPRGFLPHSASSEVRNAQNGSVSAPSSSLLFSLTAVDFEDPRAVELRRLMDEDTTRRYNPLGLDREPADFVERRTRALAIAPEQVRATLLATGPGGAPDTAAGTVASPAASTAARALGHVVLRRLGDEWELKRLFVLPEGRGRGIAGALLREAERRAAADGADRLILQTGDKQPEAVSLYRRSGYSPIPVYEPYVETMPDSLCFEKPLPTA